MQDYLESLGPDQLSAVNGLATRLALLSESHAGEYLTGGEGAIDLRRALAGPEVVLFSLNSSSYAGLSAQVGTLVVQDLVAAAGDRLARGVPGQAIIGIDEFSALDSDNVVALLARGREARVPVLLATQEFADLERAGRGVRDQVSGVTAVKIAHRQDVPASARMIAEMVGTRRVWESTIGLRRHPLLGTRQSGYATQRQVERFIIDPNEIKSLPTGHAVVITKLPEARARTVRVTPRHRIGAPSARRAELRAAEPAHEAALRRHRDVSGGAVQRQHERLAALRDEAGARGGARDPDMTELTHAPRGRDRVSLASVRVGRAGNGDRAVERAEQAHAARATAAPRPVQAERRVAHNRARRGHADRDREPAAVAPVDAIGRRDRPGERVARRHRGCERRCSEHREPDEHRERDGYRPPAPAHRPTPRPA